MLVQILIQGLVLTEALARPLWVTCVKLVLSLYQ